MAGQTARAAAPALMLIDLQEGVRALEKGERNNPDAEDRAAELLAAWRARGWPVIHVRHDSVEPHSRLRPEHPGNRVIAALAEAPGEWVERKSVNGAFAGDLAARLGAAGIDAVVIAGAETDHCVSTTARGGSDAGFAVTLVEDACFCFAKPSPAGTMLAAEALHEANVASLSGEFAAIARTADLLRGLP